MASDGTDLYWTDIAGGNVWTMPIAGGTAQSVATGQLEPDSIAVDADGVYWINDGDGTPGSSTVMKKALPLIDGAPVVLKTLDDPRSNTLALADSTLYYAELHDVHAISTDETVTGDIIVGSAPGVDDTDGIPVGLAVDPTYVVWTTLRHIGNAAGVSAVERDDRLEGTDAYLELGETVGTEYYDLVANGTNAYWITYAGIMTTSLVTPKVQLLAASLDVTPGYNVITSLAIDATNVYFSTYLGDVYSAQTANGEVVPLAVGMGYVGSLLVVGKTLYIPGGSVPGIYTVSLE